MLNNKQTTLPNTFKEDCPVKKIRNSAVNQKDRIICVTVTGAHKFYYQPCKSKERLYLFTTEDFSGSVFAYFRNNGRCMDGNGFSLTIKELYEDRKLYRNPKIGKIFDRLPGMIDYVLWENAIEHEAVKDNSTVKITNEIIYEDHKLVA